MTRYCSFVALWWRAAEDPIRKSVSRQGASRDPGTDIRYQVSEKDASCNELVCEFALCNALLNMLRCHNGSYLPPCHFAVHTASCADLISQDHSQQQAGTASGGSCEEEEGKS